MCLPVCGRLDGVYHIWYTKGSSMVRDSRAGIFGHGLYGSSDDKIYKSKKGYIMLVSFINAFLSRMVVFLVIAVVGGVATALGIGMARKKSGADAVAKESGK